MAIFDKITEVAKNVADKTSDVAKSVADKTTETLEIRALNSQINTEQERIADLKVKLGEFYWTKFANGGELDAEAAAFCAEIKEAEAKIADCRAEIQAKKETETVEAPVMTSGIQCSSCGGINPENTKFCNNCGAKFEIPVENTTCACGATLLPEAKFCNECGQPVQN